MHEFVLPPSGSRIAMRAECQSESQNMWATSHLCSNACTCIYACTRVYARAHTHTCIYIYIYAHIYIERDIRINRLISQSIRLSTCSYHFINISSHLSIHQPTHWACHRCNAWGPTGTLFGWAARWTPRQRFTNKPACQRSSKPTATVRIGGRWTRTYLKIIEKVEKV